MNAYVRAVAFLSRVCGVLAAALIGISIFIVCHAIVERGFLGRAVIWQNEFVTYAIVAATFLGSPYVLLTRGHVNVDVLPLFLGPRARFALALFAAAIGVAFCVLVLWTSIPWWLDRWETGETNNSVWAPKLWVPSLALPVGFGLLTAQYLADIYCLVTGREPPFGMPPKTPPEPAA
ncbi:MAG: TRAP transporter small permease subunit [Rhodospirillaceae bacterium]|nr:TRAP transporter small permease subunit [Rhodospirillaceae bacterium]